MRKLERYLTLTAAALGVVSTLACRDRENKLGDDSRMVGDDPTEIRAASVKNSEAAAVVRTANQGEIDEANTALPRLQSEPARNLARMMLREHSESQGKLDQVMSEASIRPEESSKTSDLRAEAAANVRSLQSASNLSVDQMYIDNQIKAHEELLKMLDDDLIDTANDPKLVQFLRETRAAVVSHIDHAKRAKDELSRSNSAPAEQRPQPTEPRSQPTELRSQPTEPRSQPTERERSY